MKRISQLSLRVLAAAVALAAAGTASAQIAVPASTNGTDLYFYAFDSSTGTSFVEDLGSNMASFMPSSTAAGTNFIANIASSSAWTTYVNTTEADSITGNLGATGTGYATGTQNTYWAVVAGIAPGGANASTYGLATTMVAGSTPITQPIGFTRSAISGPLSQFTGSLGTLLASGPTSGYFDDSTTSDNPLVSLGAGSNMNGNLKVGNLNPIGTSSTFDYYSGSKSALPTVYGNSAGNATFSFDGSNLSYAVPSIVAAVPEPSNIMMMLAGLLMVTGFVASRRNSK